jgi:methionyl-tRNA formyltransferase
MRILYLGSSPLGLPALQALFAEDSVEIAGVVSQPDKPKGRSLHMGPCPAKAFAESVKLNVMTPVRINDSDVVDSLRRMEPELIVVIAYGQILRPEVLEIPSRGCINLHASLLPAYRGAAPIQWAVANGEPETGLTTMFINERMDAGDIIYQERVPVRPDETAGELHDRLADIGAELVVRTIHAIREDRAPRVSQDESSATYARKLTKKDGRIDWTLPAGAIYNRVRGFNPWPMCWTTLPDRSRLRVLDARVEEGEGEPGIVIEACQERGLLIGAGDGALRLCRVQAEGRKVLTGSEFVRGRPLDSEERLGDDE